jgi:hypothetical protein
MSNEHVNQTVRGILDAICPPAAQPVAPLTVEVSEYQNTAIATRRLEFVAAVCPNGKRPCVVCVACASQDLCDRLPCRGRQRKDGRDGYFREVREVREVRG